MSRALGHSCAHTGKIGPRKLPEDGDEWGDTALHTHADSTFKPWRSEAELATSRSRGLPTILSFTSGWGRNSFVSFKLSRPGNEPQTLACKAAVLTTTLGPYRYATDFNGFLSSNPVDMVRFNVFQIVVIRSARGRVYSRTQHCHCMGISIWLSLVEGSDNSTLTALKYWCINYGDLMVIFHLKSSSMP